MYKKFLRTLRTAALAILALSGISPDASATKIIFDPPMPESDFSTSGFCSGFNLRLVLQSGPGVNLEVLGGLGPSWVGRPAVEISLIALIPDLWFDQNPGPYWFKIEPNLKPVNSPMTWEVYYGSDLFGAGAIRKVWWGEMDLRLAPLKTPQARGYRGGSGGCLARVVARCAGCCSGSGNPKDHNHPL